MNTLSGHVNAKAGTENIFELTNGNKSSHETKTNIQFSSKYCHLQSTNSQFISLCYITAPFKLATSVILNYVFIMYNHCQVHT